MADAEQSRPRRRQTRARAPQARRARRESILDGARNMLAQGPFEAITVARIAAEVSLAKGTVYLYFPSRESLFLALGLRELTDHYLELVPSLGPGDSERLELAEAAGITARGYVHTPLLAELLPRLHPVFETGADPASRQRFRRDLETLHASLDALLARRVMGLSAAGARGCALRFHALAAGFLPLEGHGLSVEAELTRQFTFELQRAAGRMRPRP